MIENDAAAPQRVRARLKEWPIVSSSQAYVLWLVLILSCIANPLTASANDATELRIGVLRSSLLAAIHAVALEDGFYARNSLAVKETDFDSGNGTAGFESVLRGDLDVYIGTLAELTRVDAQAIAAHQPPPLAAVAAGYPSPTTLVLRNDIAFNSVSGSKGSANCGLFAWFRSPGELPLLPCAEGVVDSVAGNKVGQHSGARHAACAAQPADRRVFA